MSSEEVARLSKLSVRDLRHHAAVKNVPLTQIAAVVEKKDLINLIIAAGPVLDTYDVRLGAKVHSANTIKDGTQDKTVKKKKKEKKKKRRRSSSSSSSTKSRKGKDRREERRRRSRSRGRAAVQQLPKKKSRSRNKSKSSSPSLTLIIPPKAPRPSKSKDLQALPAPGAASAMKALPSTADVEVVVVTPVPPVPTPVELRSPKPMMHSIAQKGMAAAAALGFDVLPKAPGGKPAAPAEGLRPTINSAAPVPYGAASLPGGRICIQYLCTSKCDLGGNCPQAHIIDPEEEMRVRARFKEQECHYGAQCSRPGCLFRHPGERFEEGHFVPEGQQVALRATPQGMQLDFM